MEVFWDVCLAVAGTPGVFDLASLSSLTPDVDPSYTGTQAAEALVIQGARLSGAMPLYIFFKKSLDKCIGINHKLISNTTKFQQHSSCNVFQIGSPCRWRRFSVCGASA
jgi:hypothetical protein